MTLMLWASAEDTLMTSSHKALVQIAAELE